MATTEIELAHRRDALAMAQVMGDRQEPTEATIDRAREYYSYLAGVTPATPAPKRALGID